jgi:hypothetical protein
MKTKKCAKCNEYKKITEFYIQNDRKNGASFCKFCFNAYCIQRWINKKIEAINYMGNKCIDCSISYPATHYSVFEFHHLDPNVKDYDWSKLRLRSQSIIKKELDKCVMLCANCHRIRHSS